MRQWLQPAQIHIVSAAAGLSRARPGAAGPQVASGTPGTGSRGPPRRKATPMSQRGYGMYGVWYAIGVTETWCSQTSAGPLGIFKVKWL